MPFFSKEDLSKIEKQEIMQDRVQAKRDTMKVNEITKPKDERMFDKAIIQNKPKPKTLKEIDQEFQVNDYINNKIKEDVAIHLNKNDFYELHDGILDILAMPQQDLQTRMILKSKLKQSDVINEYLHQNVVYRIGCQMNQHVKFACIYGLKYHQANQESQKQIKI